MTLDIKNCSCEKPLTGKLVLECEYVILMTLDIKNCSCEKPLTGKLVLECEYEILNKTKSSFNNKKVNAESNCLTRTASLVIICWLLLTVVCFSCYFYYAKYRTKQKHLSPFNDTIIRVSPRSM